jgi:hypothetical protein
MKRGRMATAGALAAVALALGGMFSAPIAVGEPTNDSWDIEEFDYCVRQTSKNLDGVDPLEVGAKVQENQRYCCHRSGGVWNGNSCVAPSGNSAGAQQVPGDIQLAPVVTPAPPQAEPPQAPNGAPVLTRPPKCPPDSIGDGCLPQKVR